MYILNIIVFAAHIQSPISQDKNVALPIVTAIFGTFMILAGSFCMGLYVICAYKDPEDSLVIH